MPDLTQWPLWSVIATFLVAAAVIGVAGVRLASVANTLADRTGMGEVIAGALFVGAATSLPGAITSMTTAAQDAPSLAVGNALGGLTAQTAFIAVADLFYRRANLEHAAASTTGLAQGVLLVILLSIPLIAHAQPEIAFFGIHPATFVIPALYAFGLRQLVHTHREPMWKPVKTALTGGASDGEEQKAKGSDRSLWTRFLILAAATAAAGYAIGEASIALVAKTGLSQTAFGTVFTAIANSLPELVTAVAAVRIGAVSLAVGDVIGGNSFEVMFLSAADLFYDGSIYHQMKGDDITTALIAMLMTGLLLLGMIRREKSGFGGIGFESAGVLALYAFSVLLLFI